MKLIACLLTLGLLAQAINISYAQQYRAPADSLSVRKHNPNKAVLYSALIPGLGQIYNQKYWKVPLVYGAGAAMIYALDYNQKKYQKFRDALVENDQTKLYLIDGLELTYDQLPLGRDAYRRYRDLSVFGIAAVYLLNIVDAMVDAYFTQFDVSDDLSLKIQPAVVNNFETTASLGVKISIGF